MGSQTFADPLAFIKFVANLSTPQDEYKDAGNDPRSAPSDFDHAATFDSERIAGEYETLCTLIRQARALLAVKSAPPLLNPDMSKTLLVSAVRQLIDDLPELNDPDTPLEGSDAVDALCRYWPALKEGLAAVTQPGPTPNLALSDGKLQTIKAALLYWARQGLMADCAELTMASRPLYGEVMPMPAEAVRAFAEKIGDGVPEIVLTMEGGVIQDVAAENGQPFCRLILIDRDEDDGRVDITPEADKAAIDATIPPASNYPFRDLLELPLTAMTEETTDWLTRNATDLHGGAFERGFIVPVKDEESYGPSVPEDLKSCIAAARIRQCHYILFDIDAEPDVSTLGLVDHWKP